MKYLMGIDLGTSSVKVMIASANGEIAGTSAAEYDISAVNPGYAEQSPQEWWEKTSFSIGKLLGDTGVDPSCIAGVGLSGQMHGAVILDSGNAPLMPAVIWADQRSSAQVDEIYEKTGRARFAEITGSPAAAGFYGPTLLWIKQHLPDVYKRTGKVILPKDYIRYRLTGEIGTEVSDASATALFDIVKQDWSAEIIDALGLKSEVFPSIYKSTRTAGFVTACAANETGLTAGTPVLFGCSDQPAQALGNGILHEGDVSVTIGTGGQVFAPVCKPIYDTGLRTHTYCHAVPDMWYVMGASLCSGLALKWLKNNILKTGSYKDLDEMAASVCAGCEGLIFLPYLAGERTPHMDPFAKGMFFGLTLRHEQRHIARAVMEGVLFALKDSLELLEKLGIRQERIIASGGGARSSFWKQMAADVFGKEIYDGSPLEQACLGACMIAGVGTGLFRSFEEAADVYIKSSGRIYRPDWANHRVYRDNHDVFKQLYRNNAVLFRPKIIRDEAANHTGGDK